MGISLALPLGSCSREEAGSQPGLTGPPPSHTHSPTVLAPVQGLPCGNSVIPAYGAVEKDFRAHLTGGVKCHCRLTVKPVAQDSPCSGDIIAV